MGLIYRGEYANPHMVELELDAIDARLQANIQGVADTYNYAVEINNYLDTDEVEAFGIFNVKTYGAIGDGISNDTAAIQSAVDAAILVHGSVFFPRGTYICSAIDLTGLHPTVNTGPFGLTMYGEGVGSVIQSDGTAGYLIDTYNASTESALHLHDLFLYGPHTLYGSGTCDDVTAIRIGQLNRYSRLERIRIVGFEYGIRVQGNAPTWYIQGLTFRSVDIRYCLKSAFSAAYWSNLAFRWYGGYIDNNGLTSRRGANGGVHYPVIDLNYNAGGESLFVGLVVEGNWGGGLNLGGAFGGYARFYGCRFEETIQDFADVTGDPYIHKFNGELRSVFRDCYFAWNSDATNLGDGYTPARVNPHPQYYLGEVSTDTVFDNCYFDDAGGGTTRSPFVVTGSPQIFAPGCTFYNCLATGQRAYTETHDFGGSLYAYVEDTDWVDLPDSPHLKISGNANVTMEVTCCAEKNAPTVTASWRLYDVTNAAAVTDSVLEQILPTEVTSRYVGTAFYLSAQYSVYKVQVKNSAGATNRIASRVRLY